jgi:hypothetical protein
MVAKKSRTAITAAVEFVTSTTARTSRPAKSCHNPEIDVTKPDAAAA